MRGISCLKIYVVHAGTLTLFRNRLRIYLNIRIDTIVNGFNYDMQTMFFILVLRF